MRICVTFTIFSRRFLLRFSESGPPQSGHASPSSVSSRSTSAGLLFIVGLHPFCLPCGLLPFLGLSFAVTAFMPFDLARSSLIVFFRASLSLVSSSLSAFSLSCACAFCDISPTVAATASHPWPSCSA